MAEPITNVLGIVSIKNRGEYNSETSYEKLNVVTYQGSSYCALKDTTGNLPTDTEYWQLYAQKGDTGDTGETGPTGPTGLTGPRGTTGNPGASPIVVDAAADMIDTTKIYVLTTDGDWYWHDTDNWKDGGVYQSTGIGEDSVSFKNITSTLKRYKKIDADDLIYIKGYSVYQGQMISRTDHVTSNGFILPKGNKISINTNFKARITCYDVNTKEYVSDSGSFDTVSNFSAADDYIVRITFVNIADPSSTQRTDGNSTNIQFEGIVPNNELVQNILDNLTVTKVCSNTRALSSKIFVGKGTKISFLDNELKYYYPLCNKKSWNYYSNRRYNR